MSRIIALDTKYGKRNPDLEKIQQAQDEYTARAVAEEIFRDLEYMGLIRGHLKHRLGETRICACSRCTYEEYKRKKLCGDPTGKT